MRIRDLIKAAYPGHESTLTLPDAVVTGVTQDASRVQPGFVFVARAGARFDGHTFIPDAVTAGASLIVGSRTTPPSEMLGGTPYLTVPDDRAAVARLAAALHGWPSRKLRVIGVTGTDGKTSTSALLWWVLQGHTQAGLFSTAMVRMGNQATNGVGHFTTPEADVVQGFLAAAVDADLSEVVLESSSHGLALRRLDDVAYDLAIWTNLTPEHLDFHGTFEAYRDAKIELVRRAPHAILNRDDASYAAFAAASAGVTTFGTHPESDWRLENVMTSPRGTSFLLHTPTGAAVDVFLPQTGAYNAWNAAAAAAAAHHEGVPLAIIEERLVSFPGVPGRMERIVREPFEVIVDFAHTPAALELALAAVKPQREGRLIVVIGAPGERDGSKRGALGRVAVQGADLALFTEDDTRSESLDEILETLAAGARDANATEGQDFHVVPDRAEAIRTALHDAGPGDVVLLAGKGHESTLAREGGTIPWSDADEARTILTELGIDPQLDDG